MKNSFLQLSYTDNIRAQIQKEQILKIIKAQKIKNTQGHKQLFKFKNPEEKPKISIKNRLINRSFSIKTKRIKQEFHKPNDNKINMSMDITEQKAYFSVKHSYQKVIHTLRDQQIVKQLRQQLNNSPKNKSRVTDKHQSCNYFQKILGNINKIKPQKFNRYMIMNQTKKDQEVRLMETSMNFYQYL